MKYRRNFSKFVLVILSVIFTLISSFVMARAFRPALLPDKGVNFSCATCHINPNGGGVRNPFGADYERIAIPAGDKYTDALAQLDSDGDGFTNAQEFSANPVTNPGDSKSHPPITPKAVISKGKKSTTWGNVKNLI
jgi:hypothetical protein